MRSQTPIQQQRRAQTQLRRGRPHNPSITRRNQPCRQRTSVMRQMQQQTRQRQARKRKSTPLPEKRGRTRQTTNRSHANATVQHMVNTHTAIPLIERRGQERRGRKRRDNTEQEQQWCSGITCVLAGLRAHYPEHQQTKRKRKKRRRTGKTKQQ